MNLTTNQKIDKIRELMKEKGIDVYLITKFDPHQSEYSKDYWNLVKYVSGFTGSAGTVVITQDKASLWTDGRYSIQAKEQVKDSYFEVYISILASDPHYTDFIYENLPENGKLGFDGRTLSLSQFEKIEGKIESKNAKIISEIDLVGDIWEDRKSDEDNKIFNLELKYAGEDRKDKIKRVRKEMENKKGDMYIISSLDDIAWLYNLRSDENASLIFDSYSIITKDEVVLFVDNERLEDSKELLISDGIILDDYENINKYIEKLINKGGMDNILICPSRTSYSLYNEIKDNNITRLDNDITVNLKTIKNPVEIENTRQISIKDGAAVFKFINWIKEEVKVNEITEYDAGKKMDSLREEIDTFIIPSFATICGYKDNGALNHYKAEKETAKTLKPEGLLLLDSGGN